MRKDGRFIGADGTVPEGQGVIMAHLNECHELVEMVRFLLQFRFHRFYPDFLVERGNGGER